MLKLDYNSNKRTIYINIDQNEFPALSLRLGDIGIEDSVISCGVNQIDGLNFLSKRLANYFSTNKIKSFKYRKEIFKFYLKKLVREIEEDNYGYKDSINSFYLLSTNVTGNNNAKLIESVLDEISECHTRRYLNKNSGRKIKVWILSRGFFR